MKDFTTTFKLGSLESVGNYYHLQPELTSGWDFFRIPNLEFRLRRFENQDY